MPKRPADYPTLHIRVPADLIPRIDRLAAAETRSRSNWILAALLDALEADERAAQQLHAAEQHQAAYLPAPPLKSPAATTRRRRGPARPTPPLSGAAG